MGNLRIGEKNRFHGHAGETNALWNPSRTPTPVGRRAVVGTDGPALRRVTTGGVAAVLVPEPDRGRRGRRARGVRQTA